MLEQIPLLTTDDAAPEIVMQLANEGVRRSKSIQCFDFVPSNPVAVFRALEALPRGRFCEWGSGMGIVTGLAALLGYQARGVEIHPQLAEASRQLLADFQLNATIEVGDYLALDHPAEVYFNYAWPSQLNDVEAHFAAIAPAGAYLLMCHGAEDIRCKVRRC